MCAANGLTLAPGGGAFIVPLELGSLLGVEGCSQGDEEGAAVQGIPYKSLVGSLLYLIKCTRPYVAMRVSILSRFCQDPGILHWEAAKRLLPYVKGSARDGLLYGKGEDVGLWRYSDVSSDTDSKT